MIVPAVLLVLLAPPPLPTPDRPDLRFQGELRLSRAGGDGTSQCGIKVELNRGETGTVRFSIGGGISCAGMGGSPARIEDESVFVECGIGWQPRPGGNAAADLDCRVAPKGAAERRRSFSVALWSSEQIVPLWVPCRGEDGPPDLWGLVLHVRGETAVPLSRPVLLDLVYEREGPPGTGPGRKAVRIGVTKERPSFSLEVTFDAGSGVGVVSTLQGEALLLPLPNGAFDLDLGVTRTLGWTSKDPDGGERGASAGSQVEKRVRVARGETVRLDFPEFVPGGDSFRPQWYRGARDRLYVTIAEDPAGGK